MSKPLALKILASLCGLVVAANLAAADKTVIALNPLSASGDLSEEKELISEIMQSELSSSQSVTIVERESLLKALREQKLSEQGMLDPSSAKKIGQILGAKFFCSGIVRSSGAKTVAIVKIVDVETSVVKMTYAETEGKAGATDVGKSLARGVEKIVGEFNLEKALAEKAPQEDSGKKIPAEWPRPSVMVVIPEIHIAQERVIDPAAQTEIVKALLDANFKVIDSEYALMMRLDASNAQGIFSDKKTLADYAAKKGADVLIFGEAISEFGANLDQFKGCRARVEIKAMNAKTSELLLSDSAYGGASDLGEIVAGKKAIQEAAKKLAAQALYPLAEKWSQGKAK